MLTHSSNRNCSCPIFQTLLFPPPVLFYGVGNDSPNQEIIFRNNPNLRIIGIRWNQPDDLPFYLDSFQCKLPVNEADYQIIILHIQGFVYDKHVTFHNSFILHGITNNAAKKCGSRMPDQFFIKVNSLFKIILSLL